MPLDTMTPDPDWDPAGHGEAIETLAALPEAVTFTVWCDDGCGDCQAQLPAFAAALRAAGVDEDRVEQIAVERLPEGEKRGPLVEEYGIERIPTIVVERDGRELARYVETADLPAADYLARQLADVAASA